MFDLDYWGFKKNPFKRTPDAEMYYAQHRSVDEAATAVSEAIDDRQKCLAVVVGPVGVGKTMCLRRVLDGLDYTRSRVAYISNPGLTFPQFLDEMIHQLEGRECADKRKDFLLESFGEILSQTSQVNGRVILFIDENNMIRQHNLETLRLLTNIHETNQGAFLVVVAGQPELGRRLEDPRRASLFKRVGAYRKIEGFGSPDAMIDYVEYRLQRAGREPGTVFTGAAFSEMWKHSQGGNPRIVNIIIRLCLRSGVKNEMQTIDGKLVASIGTRLLRTIHYMGEKKESERSAGFTQQIPLPPIVEQSGPAPKAPAPGQTSAPPRPGEAPPSRPIAPPPKEATIRIGGKLSQKEIEDMASRLATEKVKKLKDVADSFEAWETARAEILAQITKKMQAEPEQESAEKTAAE